MHAARFDTIGVGQTTEQLVQLSWHADLLQTPVLLECLHLTRMIFSRFNYRPLHHHSSCEQANQLLHSRTPVEVPPLKLTLQYQHQRLASADVICFWKVCLMLLML